MEARNMKVKVFPARVKKLSKNKTALIEKALLSAPKVPIARLHDEARQFERMMLYLEISQPGRSDANKRANNA